jgi:predicted nucleic acid-binding protein
VICLDTNYLICGLADGTPEARDLVRWHRRGERLTASSVAWYEFLCGPVTAEHVAVIRAFLTGGVFPFDDDQAAEAARLYHAIDRVRRLRVNAMIASAAILAGASLATGNRADFEIFRPFGLELV